MLSGAATQSSEASNGSPGKAVDGGTNQQYPGGSCTHTASASPWWRLTLAQGNLISKVEVWNRVDGGSDISSRLNGVQVKVGSQLCGTLSGSTAKQTIVCGQTGTVVELQMPRNEYLSLCEVKVFGGASSLMAGV